MERSIEYVLEVAKCNGITKAAENLCITPSALSKYIKTTEHDLQVKLFNRSGKRFVLTSAGEFYVQKSLEINRINQELQTQMQLFAGDGKDLLRVGVQASFLNVLTGSVIPEFQKKYPASNLLLEEQNISQLLLKLKNNQIDVLLAVVDDIPQACNSEILYNCQMVAAVHKGADLIRNSVVKKEFQYPWIDLSECAKLPNIMLIQGNLFRMYASSIYETAGVMPRVSVQVNSTRSGLTCVANGLGIMLTLDHMVLNNEFSDKIVPLSIGVKPVTKPLVVLYSQYAELKDAIGHFIDICRKHIR